MIRGLDDDEVGFLNYVDNLKDAELKMKATEEKQFIDEVNKVRVLLISISPTVLYICIAT